MWPQFAKEEYYKWRKVSNLVHNLEKQLGSSADQAVQSMIKEIELFAESSKRTFKEVFLINDSFASNTMSEARSSKLDPFMKGNQCFERKMAIKGPKFINFIEKNSSEVSQNEETKRAEPAEIANDSPTLSKKGLSAKWKNKEILEKWVEPSDKQSASSAAGGHQMSKSNIILISQLNLESSPARDGFKPSPTSASSSPRPLLFTNLFSNEKDRLGSPQEIRIIERLKEVEVLPEEKELGIQFHEVNRPQYEPLEKRISTVESYEEDSAHNQSGSHDSFGDFQYTRSKDQNQKSRKFSSSKSKEGLDYGDIDSKSHPENTPDTELKEPSDSALIVDHISAVLLELLVEEAILDANDILINHQRPHEVQVQINSNPSLGVVSLGFGNDEPSIFSIQGINEFILKTISFLIDYYGMQLVPRFNQSLKLDGNTVIRLVRELELELFQAGGGGVSENFDGIIRSCFGNFLEDDLYLRLSNSIAGSLKQLTPRSVENRPPAIMPDEDETSVIFKKLLFDCMNEVLTNQWLKTDSIDFVRLISMGKQPSPKPSINLPGLENILFFMRDQVLDYSMLGCGTIGDRGDYSGDPSRTIDPILLKQFREERLVKMLSQEVT
jgi:hypothetical protein